MKSTLYDTLILLSVLIIQVWSLGCTTSADCSSSDQMSCIIPTSSSIGKCGCHIDSDCAGSLICKNNACIECQTSNDCAGNPTGPICKSTSTYYTLEGPVTDPSDYYAYTTETNTYCGCDTESDCPSSTPICNTTLTYKLNSKKTCISCSNNDTICASNIMGSQCLPSGKCGCVEDSDCKYYNTRCSSNNLCGTCAIDSHCAGLYTGTKCLTSNNGQQYCGCRDSGDCPDSYYNTCYNGYCSSDAKLVSGFVMVISVTIMMWFI